MSSITMGIMGHMTLASRQQKP